MIDAAMVDGATVLMMHGFKAAGVWKDQRESNFIDGGSHFYNTYETSDTKFISIGAIEPQFYRLLLETTGVSDPDFNEQMNSKNWPGLVKKLADVFKTKTHDEWCRLMEGTDICFAPVLSMEEAMNHPHLKARNTLVNYHGIPQPAPAPRFSRTKPEIQSPPPSIGEHNETAFKDWGFSEAGVTALKAAEVI